MRKTRREKGLVEEQAREVEMWQMEVLELDEIRSFHQKNGNSDIASSGICRRILIGVLCGYRDGSDSRPFVLLKQFLNVYPKI